ncbi:MAG TPA: hypothetical protein VGF59_08575 [Bryobacteraceae bacterium]|jgi:hypothetical protein
MLNFREFEAGPDPFGRKFQVLFKWLQTAISIRHADTVDVKFILTDDSGARTEKTIALPHADLLRVSRDLGRPMDDAWCARIAQMHLLHLITSGEDVEKDLVTVQLPDIERYARELSREEQSAVRS